jgi:hypothetical protein
MRERPGDGETGRLGELLHHFDDKGSHPEVFSAALRG